MEAGLEEYRSIRQWLENLAESTQRINLYAMNTFLSRVAKNSEKFGRFSPDDFAHEYYYYKNIACVCLSMCDKDQCSVNTN